MTGEMLCKQRVKGSFCGATVGLISVGDSRLILNRQVRIRAYELKTFSLFSFGDF